MKAPEFVSSYNILKSLMKLQFDLPMSVSTEQETALTDGNNN